MYDALFMQSGPGFLDTDFVLLSLLYLLSFPEAWSLLGHCLRASPGISFPNHLFISAYLLACPF